MGRKRSYLIKSTSPSVPSCGWSFPREQCTSELWASKRAAMTNAPSTVSDRSSAPLRSSYASVAAGPAGSSQYQSQASTNQTVSLSDIMNPLPPSTPLSAPFLERTRQIDSESGIPSFLEHRRRMKKTVESSYHLGFGRIRQELAWERSLALPSYLRGSRYGVQLRNQQLRREQTPREKSSVYHTNNGGSASSSSVSLPKLQPSSRGMTYDVIEPEVPLIDEVPFLPSGWSETDKNKLLELHSEGQEVRYVSHGPHGPHGRNEYEAAAVRTDLHIPSACGVYYYEVAIASKGRDE